MWFTVAITGWTANERRCIDEPLATGNLHKGNSEHKKVTDLRKAVYSDDGALVRSRGHIAHIFANC